MAVKQIGLRPRSLWGERDKIVWLREARGAVCCCTGEGEVGTMDIQGRLQRRRPFTRLCSSPPGVHLRGARPEEQLKIRAKRVGRIYRETQKSWRIKGMTLPRNGSVEANAALRHAGVKPGISVTSAVGITAY